MRVLVTGAAGMLGTDLCTALSAAGHDPIGCDCRGDYVQLDVTDHAAARAVVDLYQPDAVIHCAAYTNVDLAETEGDAAFRINALGSWVIAAVCAESDVPLCAISTDFVFDGSKSEPYTEWDTPNPISRYGASKLAGELCVRDLCRKHWIARTAWLYGLNGKNFPNSILTAAEAGKPLRVVGDQRGCPTFTADLAGALVELISSPLYGTYHIVNRGATSWHGLAQKAVDLAGLSVAVTPISSDEWPTPVKRPANSVLRPYALELQGRYTMRPWEEALADYVARRKDRLGA